MRTTDYVSKLMSIAQSENPNNSIDVRIAQTMLAHLKELGNLQNQEIAAICFVDAATVSRFVRNLGFLKYGEFKSYFKEYNEIHDVSYFYDFNNIPTSKSMIDNACHAIECTYQLLDEKKISEVGELIRNTPEILIGGDRFSQLVAQDLQLKLLSFGIYAKTYNDTELQIEEIQQNQGLFILFSASCTRSQTIIDLAKKRGWKIVIITRNNQANGDEVILYDNQYLSDWTVNSVNDRLCMGIIVDQLILKIASFAINEIN